MKIRIEHDALAFGDGLRVTFQRTLRIPDDGRRYPLPPGLGSFPLRNVDDYRDRVPEDWRAHGGVFLPMYQREAMWLLFSGPHWKPSAVKVGIGKVCAITGEAWSDELHADSQDYLVTPPQPWLDGICVGKGVIRQFVAMPLGLGYTVEGQLTGEEKHGGLQIRVFDPKPGRFPDEAPVPHRIGALEMACYEAAPASSELRHSRGRSMGLAAGGRMKQKIYPDPDGIETWDAASAGRVFVHIVNSELWREITGDEPPTTPVTARSYARAKLPWFDLYDENAAALESSSKLVGVKGTAELDAEKSTQPLADDDPLNPGPLKKLWIKLKTGGVRDGDW